MNVLVDVNEILHFGLAINTPAGPPRLPIARGVLEQALEQRRTGSISRQARREQGIALWRRVCSRIAADEPGSIVIPLSGGLDSRAILAGMVEFARERITTVTFGMPGAFDYDIAPRIARRAGVAHRHIDVRRLEINRDVLIAAARESGPLTHVLDTYYGREVQRRFGKLPLYLSGYLSDVLAGTNIKQAPFQDWEQARRHCAQRLCASREMTITPAAYDPVTALPDQPYVEANLLPYDEQLDVAVRQERYFRPNCLPQGYRAIAPMLDSDWIAFCLGIKRDWRSGRAFYLEMFRYGFPELFELPSTATGGLHADATAAQRVRYRKKLRRQRRRLRLLNRVLPGVAVPPADRNWQYLDFRDALRREGDFLTMFTDCMARLDASGLVPHLDASALLEAHRLKQADHFKALNALLNLEIFSAARPQLFPRRAY